MSDRESLFFLSELRKFLRIETSLLITCMAFSGYFIFNEPGWGAAFIAPAMFFASAASYAYNQYTDRGEDMINNKRLNVFVGSRNGYVIMLACGAISIVSATSLPALPFMLYITTFVGSLAYSGLRIKRFFLVKNLYSGLSVSASFLVGATMSNLLDIAMLPYFMLLILLTLTSNLMGDVRGYTGDQINELKTIPVILGMRLSKMVIYFNILLFSSVAVMHGYHDLMTLIPFLGGTMFFVNKDHHRIARAFMLMSFIMMLPFVLMIRNMEW